jgi:hypothetical protein
MGAGVASAQTPSANDPLASRDEALKGVVGYVGPRMEPTSFKWPDQPPAEASGSPYLDAMVEVTACIDQGGVATSVDLEASSGVPSLDAMAVERRETPHTTQQR